jgi:NTP pyrophosphatase (non-canonical NTP hydrolase)
MREFSKWAGQQIERVCKRNDKPRPGKPLKPPWEKQPPGILYEKITEECQEMVEAYYRWLDCPTRENAKLLQWELADLATIAMMLSGNLDPIISGLRRGKIKEPKWVRGKIPGKEIKGPPPKTSISVDNMKSILKGQVNNESKMRKSHGR